jgi:hypothetical protein
VRQRGGMPELTPTGILIRDAGLMARESNAGAAVGRV